MLRRIVQVLASLVFLWLLWAGLYLFAINYSISKIVEFKEKDYRTRAAIEDNKGILFSRTIAPQNPRIAPYLTRGLGADVERKNLEIVEYYLLGAYFTHFYDQEGNLVQAIGNGT